LGHQLHQSLRAFGRDGAHVEAALGADDAGDEIGIELVGSAGVPYGLIQIEADAVDGRGGLRGAVEREPPGSVWRLQAGRLEVVDLGGGMSTKLD
jgi:hypothetical protein